MNMDFSVPKLRVVVGSLSFLQCAVGEVSSVTLKAMLRRSELPLRALQTKARGTARTFCAKPPKLDWAAVSHSQGRQRVRGLNVGASRPRSAEHKVFRNCTVELYIPLSREQGVGNHTCYCGAEDQTSSNNPVRTSETQAAQPSMRA